MNKVVRLPQSTPYEADYALWCAEQGALLRAGKLDLVDRENVAEEIESLGRSDRREIEGRLKPLLAHLLKWRMQKRKRSGSWKATISEQRLRIAKILAESPSLKRYPGEVLEQEYSFSRWDAAKETGLPITAFPEECPFTIEQALDKTYLPD